MRHWPQDGASDLEQELLELMREETPEPSDEAQEQVFAALSANLDLGAATGVGTGAGKAAAGAKASAAGTAVAGTQAVAGVGSGVFKLALVGLVLGGATAGVGHFVSTPSAASGAGGEEQRSASVSQSKPAQGPAHQALPQGSVAHAVADPASGNVAQPAGTAGATRRDSASAGAASAEATAIPDVAPGSSVARFGEASAGVEAPAPSAASQLEAERAALAEARQALQGGNAPRALGLLTQLSQRYPKLKLSQEHEALSIRALAASGAKPQAVTRAQRFVALYPNSPLTPGVREVLR